MFTSITVCLDMFGARIVVSIVGLDILQMAI